MLKFYLAAALLVLSAGTLMADEVEIVDVEVHQTGKHLFQFDVTLKHGDTGWEHYADAWEVLSPDGELLGRRVLYHPHLDEQPFTRSLGGVEIQGKPGHVMIRAHDKVHGYANRQYRVDLPPGSTP